MLVSPTPLRLCCTSVSLTPSFAPPPPPPPPNRVCVGVFSNYVYMYASQSDCCQCMFLFMCMSLCVRTVSPCMSLPRPLCTHIHVCRRLSPLCICASLSAVYVPPPPRSLCIYIYMFVFLCLFPPPPLPAPHSLSVSELRSCVKVGVSALGPSGLCGRKGTVTLFVRLCLCLCVCASLSPASHTKSLTWIKKLVISTEMTKWRQLLHFSYPELELVKDYWADVPLVEFMYRIFTCIPGENYHRLLGSLLLYLCYIFRALINSLVLT